MSRPVGQERRRRWGTVLLPQTVRAAPAMELLLTRDYLPKQTALYLKCLTFRDDALRNEFLREWPHYQIERQIEKLERERRELAEKLQARIDRDGYDLSKISADQRLTVASRHVEAATKIHDLDWQVRYLREAIRLQGEWAGSRIRARWGG